MAISPDDPLAYRLGVRAREPLNTAGQFISDLAEVGGYGLASGTAGLLDLALRRPRQLASTAENIVAGLRGAPAPAAYDPYQLQRAVESWGVPDAAYRWGLNAFPQAGPTAVAPVQGGGPIFIDGSAGMDAAPPAPQPAPIFIDGTSNMDVAPPALNPAPTGTFKQPAATTTTFAGATPATEVLRVAPRVEAMPDLRAYGPNVRAPVQCDSGVCYPDIRSGNFYANAEQAGIARSVPFGGTEADRYALERVRQQLLPGGAAGLARGEQAVRALNLQDLRTTPGYNEALAVATRNVGGRRALGQAITDQYFFGHDPDLDLALIENDTSPRIDQASSQAAALAMATGDATLANRVTEAARSVGYSGASGGLPYGLAPAAPAVVTPDAILQLQNVPSSLSAPARATAGGSIGELARRDAGEQALQAASAAGVAAFARQAQALGQLYRNSPEWIRMRERIIQEERARGRTVSAVDVDAFLEKMLAATDGQ